MLSMNILIVFGTRPEAIKMAPLVQSLENDERFESRVCVTAQHREMLDQVLALFNIVPYYDLDIMKANQSLNDVTTNILIGLKPVLDNKKEDNDESESEDLEESDTPMIPTPIKLFKSHTVMTPFC